MNVMEISGDETVMKKDFLIGAMLFLLFLGVIVSLFGRVIPSRTVIQDVRNENCALMMDKDMFYHQSKNNCGPYSVMAIINIVRRDKVDPEHLVKERRWEILDTLTFPQGVVALLKANGIRTNENVLRNRTDKEKLAWIKANISNGNPVILLIDNGTLQHYVTVAGYTDKGFMLYDSLQTLRDDNSGKTIVDKECITGNRFWTEEELLSMWNNGGFWLFFRNWAVVCSI